jgi:hypothetical protein
VFENRVVRGIFGLKRDEVIGCWRKLHNELFHNLYSMKYNCNDEVRGDEMVGKPEGKRPLNRRDQTTAHDFQVFRRL